MLPTGYTGALIFVSVAERHAEILADTAIDARVPQGTWKRIVAAAEGLGVKAPT